MRCALAILFVVASVRAGEIADAADAVLAAIEAQKGLKELAERERPDPWRVADELCARGKHDAAVAFARAAPRKAVERLPAYIGAQLEKPTGADLRRRLGDVIAATERKDWPAVVEATNGVDESRDDVTTFRLLQGRGIALRSMRKTQEAAKAFVTAAALAERMSWWSGAAIAHNSHGFVYYFASNWRAARAPWQRNLELAEQLDNRYEIPRALNNLGLLHLKLNELEEARDLLQRSLNFGGTDPERIGNALNNLALIHDRLGEWDRAIAVNERSLEIRKKSGDTAGVAMSLVNLAKLHARRGEHDKAMASAKRVLELREQLGDRSGVADALRLLGMLHTNMGVYGQARDYLLRALKVFQALGERQEVGTTLAHLAQVRLVIGDHATALKEAQQALEIQQSLRNGPGMLAPLGVIGQCQRALGNYEEAAKMLELSLVLQTRRGDREQIANVRNSLAKLRLQQGRMQEATDHAEAALEILDSIGGPNAVRVRANLGAIYALTGDFGRALPLQLAAVEALEDSRNRATYAQLLDQTGRTYWLMGNLDAALELCGRALEIREALKLEYAIAESLNSIGIIHIHRGDHAAALEYHARALDLRRKADEPALLADSLGNHGILYGRLGDHDKALEYHEQALAIRKKLGRPVLMAESFSNLGATHHVRGEHEKALELQRQALAIYRDTGRRTAVANALTTIAVIESELDNHTEALERGEEALVIAKDLGHRSVRCSALKVLALVHARHGDFERALERGRSALELATEIGNTSLILSALWEMAGVRFARKEYTEAAEAARDAVAAMPLLVGRVSDELAASARSKRFSVFELGALAAYRTGDIADVCHFLESGRAGALLESLRGRDAVRRAVLPAKLIKEENDARVAEKTAAADHERALRRGQRRAIRGAREALQTARDARAEVVARIQRTAKLAANSVYPEAAPLETIQAALADGDTLVLFTRMLEESFALVVTSKKARVVELPDAVSSELHDLEADPDEALPVLRRALIEPLGIADAKRLLISPGGAFTYVPFAALLPGVDIVYVPSGTTYVLLRDLAAERGAGVLALGDPKRVDTVPLPASRKEAAAVGDVVALGADASEEALEKKLAQRPRWRAVHFACHGLIDAERPMLSSLALAPGSGQDGNLTTLEIFQSRIPADLVVLSACETAKGKVYHAEGVMGFTRAFMVAGAPRVLVSLWKVDDAATHALMVKFYELWKKQPAATALRQAMDHVRSQEKWKHPYYWAAWQLWGLPG